jgi:hypothetical protein
MMLSILATSVLDSTQAHGNLDDLSIGSGDEDEEI